jgi:hypothetical protein
MTVLEIRHCQEVREALIGIMRSGRRFAKRDLVEALRKDGYFAKNFSEQRLGCIVGNVLRLYTSDFYRDPSDKRISLTLSRSKTEREKTVRNDGREQSFMVGTTAGGLIHDLMERADIEA